MRLRHWVIVLAAAALWLVAAAPGYATFPGANGKVAGTEVFATDEGVDDIDIFTVNPDGTDFHYRTGFPPVAYENSPTWSPDSSKIAYSTNRDGNEEIYVMNPNGSGATRVTNNSAFDSRPAWSPDGTKIVFVSGRDGNYEIYVMNPDGTGQTRLTNNSSNDLEPDWSPDGTKIAFETNRDGNYEIYVMNPDGTGQTRLTNDLGFQGDPSWSPDNSKIAYSDSGNISVMNRDGSDQTQITSDGSGYTTPAWSPDGTRFVLWQSDIVSNETRIIVMNISGTGVTPLLVTRGDDYGLAPDWGGIPLSYARPKGASPFLTYLVPAYDACTAPNRTHGAPLAFPSCDPPQQSSSQLTIGAPDANGLPAATIGSVRHRVAAGDVKIDVSVTGVLTKPSLAPYGGELALDDALRITDRANAPNPGGPGPGTVEDTSFQVAVPCAAGTCTVATSANAVLPGAVVTGKREIWQLGQVRAYDGGPDGNAETTGDNTLFMTQGLFVP